MWCQNPCSCATTTASSRLGSSLIAKSNNDHLNDQDADHHRERQPITAELDEFLEYDHQQAAKVETRTDHR